MDVTHFVVLLIVSVVVSGILHYGLKVYVTEGTWSFISKCIVGYVGASCGDSWFGAWSFSIGGVDIVAAALGSFALLVVAIDVVKALRR